LDDKNNKSNKSEKYAVVDKTTKVFKIFTVFAVLLLFGTCVYHVLEGWSYVTAFYFAVSTLTTVGYGDVYVHTDESRLFTAFYILAGTSVFFYGLFLVGEHVIEDRIIKLERSIRSGPRVRTQDEVLKDILNNYNKSYKDKLK